MIDLDHLQLSLVRQCILLDVSRVGVDYPAGTDQGRRPGVDALMSISVGDPLLRLQQVKAWLLPGLSDEPTKGSGRPDAVDGSGSDVPAAQTSKPAPGTSIFPYLQKGVEV